ncbi:MAG: HlyD family efflux transporter periplasmic adaptor subunit [Planctomycetes bacterium]|nr:HlyD family efflux transporter periplasmic adaptor subunit [Planctomycetota bacterium]
MTMQPASALPAAPTTPSSPAPDHPALLTVGKLDGSIAPPGPPDSRPARSRARGKRSTLLLYIAAAVLVVAGTAAAYVIIEKPFNKPRSDLVTQTVQRGRLELKIVEQGTLEAANNSDVTCGVKAKGQGSTVATTIRSLVDDGTHVVYDRPKDQVKTVFIWDENAGKYNEEPVSPSGRVRCVKVKNEKTKQWVYADLLIELDDSALQDQMTTQKITVEGKESEKIAADESFKITLVQNESKIKTAEVAVDLADINLKKYQKGDYIQKFKDYEGQIKDAQAKVEQQRDRLAWATRMVKKGLYTASQAQSEQLSLESLELTLGKAEEQKRVLTEYEKVQQETDLRNKLETAKRDLATAKAQALSDETQARSKRDTAKSTYLHELSRYKDMIEQLQKCKVWAPRTGIVVYYIPEQARWGIGGNQRIVAQGESVNEGQKMMQIPDLDHMLVNTKVHEALASRVHKGQKAVVKVQAFPDQALRARVESVATIAAAGDFLSSDVKVYPTKLAIDKTIEGLKPGGTAEVTIIIGDALENVLKVPIEAVVGAAEMGKIRKVFVLKENEPEERDVLIGASNDQEVEIREGLQEGEKVVRNPKNLVGDSVKTRKRGEYKEEEPPSNPSGPNVPSAKPAAKPGQGTPGAGAPGGGAPGAGGGGQQMDPETKKKRMEQGIAWFKSLPKEQRKEMLNRIPEAGRAEFKAELKKNGVEIPE